MVKWLAIVAILANGWANLLCCCVMPAAEVEAASSCHAPPPACHAPAEGDSQTMMMNCDCGTHEFNIDAAAPVSGSFKPVPPLMAMPIPPRIAAGPFPDHAIFVSGTTLHDFGPDPSPSRLSRFII